MELEAHSGLLASVAPPGDGTAAELRAEWQAVSGRLLTLRDQLLTLTAAADREAEVGTGPQPHTVGLSWDEGGRIWWGWHGRCGSQGRPLVCVGNVTGSGFSCTIGMSPRQPYVLGGGLTFPCRL